MTDHPWADIRAAFNLPADQIYLLGHSLGPASHATLAAVATCAQQQWAAGLADSWNSAGWMEAPARVGAKIAQLIGAAAEEVHVCDSVTVNVFKLAGAAKMASGRAEFVVEADGFPTDSYALEGVVSAIGGYAVMVGRDELCDAITQDTAAVIATEVDFRTGHRLSIKDLADAASAKGALSLIDLSHSTGAVAVDLTGAGVDLAVGCGYKYLNGGPGAPGFVFVARRHHGRLQTPLPGWMGHAAPFAFEPDFSPAPSAKGFAAGTPPILSLAALDAALDHFAGINMQALADYAHALGEAFDASLSPKAAELGFKRVTPKTRGAHLAYRFAHGFALKEALRARGVVGDFRTPDILRFGFSPLFLTMEDCRRAGALVSDCLAMHGWRDYVTAPTPVVT